MLLNVYRDQTVDTSTVRWWLMCFSTDNKDVCDKPHSTQLSTQKKARASISSFVQISPLYDGLDKKYFYNKATITDVKKWVTSVDTDLHEYGIQVTIHPWQNAELVLTIWRNRFFYS